MVKDIAFAGWCQHDELVGQVTANRAGIRLHRNCIKAHAGKGAHISDEHAIIAVLGTGEIGIEAIGILHQEFAAAQHAKARAHFIAKLPLDLVDVLWQVAIRLGAVLENLGEQFLGGRAEQHLAVMTIGDTQHFGAISIIAPRLPPQVGGLDRRHQHFDGTSAILLLANDLFDLGEHAPAQRQPGIDARRSLADHAGAQHQLVRNHLGIARGFLEDR